MDDHRTLLEVSIGQGSGPVNRCLQAAPMWLSLWSRQTYLEIATKGALSCQSSHHSLGYRYRDFSPIFAMLNLKKLTNFPNEDNLAVDHRFVASSRKALAPSVN